MRHMDGMMNVGGDVAKKKTKTQAVSIDSNTSVDFESQVVPAINFLRASTGSQTSEPGNSVDSVFETLFTIADEVLESDVYEYRENFGSMDVSRLVEAIQVLSVKIFGSTANQEFLSNFNLEM